MRYSLKLPVKNGEFSALNTHRDFLFRLTLLVMIRIFRWTINSDIGTLLIFLSTQSVPFSTEPNGLEVASGDSYTVSDLIQPIVVPDVFSEPGHRSSTA